jgi:hypothetical protein
MAAREARPVVLLDHRPELALEDVVVEELEDVPTPDLAKTEEAGADSARDHLVQSARASTKTNRTLAWRVRYNRAAAMRGHPGQADWQPIVSARLPGFCAIHVVRRGAPAFGQHGRVRCVHEPFILRAYVRRTVQGWNTCDRGDSDGPLCLWWWAPWSPPSCSPAPMGTRASRARSCVEKMKVSQRAGSRKQAD